jgi:hypothetical protein
MSTPEQPGGPPTGTPGGPTGGSGDRPGMSPLGYSLGTRGDLARMPIPGNAEFLIVVLASILLALLAWVADGISDAEWAVYFVAITVAYLISRGIAKASRVLEQ